MSKHSVDSTRFPGIAVERYANNGAAASASALRGIANVLNQVSSRQKKQFFVWVQALNSVAAGAGSAAFIRPRFITGHNTTGVRVDVGVVLTDYVGATPAAAFTIKDTGGSNVSNKTVYYHGTSSGTSVVLDDINHTTVWLEGLSANTEYYLEVDTLTGVRMVYMVAAEMLRPSADDTVTAVCNPGPFVSEGPIYHTHVQDLADAANSLWRHNGKHLISCIPDYDLSTVMTASSTTYTNILDATTAVASSSIGFKLYTTYDGTSARANAIPVKMAVRTERTAGAGTLDVQLTDGTNTLSITGIGGSLGWSTATGTIPAQSGTKWDVHARVSAGGTSFRIYNVSLFEYEA